MLFLVTFCSKKIADMILKVLDFIHVRRRAATLVQILLNPFGHVRPTPPDACRPA